MKKLFVYVLSFIFVVNLYGNSLEKNNKFYLGIHNTPYAKIKINGESINDIITDLFKNYLKLDVVKVKGDWRKTYNDLDSGITGGLGLVTMDDHRKSNILLSKPLFLENLYIASLKKPLKSNFDLENQNIYVYKDDIMIENLKRYLKINKIKANIIEVNKLNDYRGEYFLDSTFTVLGVPNKMFISHLPPVSIGVNKKYSYLLPKINEGIDKIYGKKIRKYIDGKSTVYQRKIFLEKLTPREIEVLKSYKVLTTSYEDDLTLSLYSKFDDKYIGILPAYINKISKITGIKIKIENKGKVNYTWNRIYDQFKESKIDFLSLAINNENRDRFLFTKAIENIPIYLLTNPDDKDQKLGVLINGKSEAIGNMYFPYNEIIKYPSKKKLFKAFYENKVNSIITTYSFSDSDDKYVYRMEEIGNIPITFAFHKNERILRDIFNKALSVIGEYDRKKMLSEINYEKRQNLIDIKKENLKYLFLNGIGCFLVLILIGALIYRVITYKKIEKLAKFDVLTNLQNRILFNEVCLSSNEKEGLVGVLDLDNFKNANDKYGHSVGDLALIEIGGILLGVFDKKSTFRISGDEFYIFQENVFNDTKIDEFLNRCKNSKLLEKYKVTVSFGYLFKRKDMGIDEAFKLADKNMYVAKKILGFSKYKNGSFY